MRALGFLATLLLLGFVLVVQPAARADALSCDEPGERLCLFAETNFQGTLSLYGNLSQERCNSFSEGKRSFRASTVFGGTLYETADCQGRSVAVTRGSENPDFGFVAHGWKQTVTCDSPDQLCLFEKPGYAGVKDLLGDIGDNKCRNLPAPGKQSFQAGDHREGYLYAKSNCQGSPIVAVAHGQHNPDIGTIAYSFKQACVSCRAKPN